MWDRHKWLWRGIWAMMFCLSVAGLYYADAENTASEQQAIIEKRTPIILVDDNGCQYLQSQYGGITPRLNKYGHQVCYKP